MTILQAILLGIVQGLTEFIPVSSSAHLVIVPYLLGWQIPANEAFIFDVLVQVATLIAVIIYFWKDLVAIVRAFLLGLWHKKPFEDTLARLGWLIILATIPAGLIGLALKSVVERAFASPIATGFFLFITAIILFLAERVGKRNRKIESIHMKDAIWIGFAQAISIFPGVSRSGVTISAGVTRDFERPAAARFSFLLSIPIMLAAGLLATLDLLKLPNIAAGSGQSSASLLLTFIPGFIAAGVVGYLSIRWLLAFLARRPLYIFSIYCAAMGFLVIGISIFK